MPKRKIKVTALTLKHPHIRGTGLMTPATIEAITLIAKNDPSTSEDEFKLIRSLKTGTRAQRKKLVNRKEVMQILGVSAPTLRKIIKSGKVTEIKISPRKSRFDYEQIIELLQNGA